MERSYGPSAALRPGGAVDTETIARFEAGILRTMSRNGRRGARDPTVPVKQECRMASRRSKPEQK